MDVPSLLDRLVASVRDHLFEQYGFPDAAWTHELSYIWQVLSVATGEYRLGEELVDLEDDEHVLNVLQRMEEDMGGFAIVFRNDEREGEIHVDVVHFSPAYPDRSEWSAELR